MRLISCVVKTASQNGPRMILAVVGAFVTAVNVVMVYLRYRPPAPVLLSVLLVSSFAACGVDVEPLLQHQHPRG